MMNSWPFPKVIQDLRVAQRNELKPYFQYCMDRWNVGDETRALAWINASHDFTRALACYRAIWLMDQKLQALSQRTQPGPHRVPPAQRS